MTRLANACKAYGLTVSRGKIVVMLQQVPGAEPLPQPNITVHGTTLNNVSQLVYLGGIVTDDASVYAEVTQTGVESVAHQSQDEAVHISLHCYMGLRPWHLIK